MCYKINYGLISNAMRRTSDTLGFGDAEVYKSVGDHSFRVVYADRDNSTNHLLYVQEAWRTTKTSRDHGRTTKDSQVTDNRSVSTEGRSSTVSTA